MYNQCVSHKEEPIHVSESAHATIYRIDITSFTSSPNDSAKKRLAAASRRDHKATDDGSDDGHVLSSAEILARLNDAKTKRQARYVFVMVYGCLHQHRI